MLKIPIYFNLNQDFLWIWSNHQPFRVTRISGFFEPLFSSATVLPFPLKAALSCAFVTLRSWDFSVFPI
jgi:hypothetical protein